MNVIVTGDIFRPEQQSDTLVCHQRHNIKWFSENILSKISSAKVLDTNGITPLSFEDWYKTDIPNIGIQIDYVPLAYNWNDFIIGFELPNNLIHLLSRRGVNYIDVNVHPVRFCDKRILGIRTNDSSYLNKIVPESYMYEQASKYIGTTHVAETLVVGQTRIDRSLLKNGKLAKLEDFRFLFEALTPHKCAYKAHPLDMHNGKWLVEDLFFADESDSNIYELLASPSLKRVIGISSSVLYEAKYFNKPSLFLQEREMLTNLIPVFEDVFFNEVLDEVVSRMS